MNKPAVNSSSPASLYDWRNCYENKGNTLGRPSAGLLVLFLTYCLEFIIGVPSNLWLICHILRNRSKVAGVLPADFFPLHLAFTQLLFFLILPTFLVDHYLWKSASVLPAMTFMTLMVLVLKPLLLCVVCVERYMAVVRPLVYLRFKAQKYRWGYLSASCCIYVLMISTAGHSSIAVCVLFIPILVIDTFCCLSVLKTLQKPPPGDKVMMEKKKEEKRKTQEKSKEERKEEKVKKVERSKPRGKGEMNSMKKKAFFTIAIIQAVLTLNYLPLIITLPMDGLVPAHTLMCQFEALALAAAASCSYLQPVLYLYRLGRLPCMTSHTT